MSDDTHSVGLRPGAWLCWYRSDEAGRAKGVDYVAPVPGGYWMATVDGALLEHWLAVGMVDEKSGETVVIREAFWEMHTGAGTSRGRTGKIRGIDPGSPPVYVN